MNPLETRYAVFKALNGHEDVENTELVSPVPGKPVELLVCGTDGRRYRISFEEVGSCSCATD